MPQDFDPDKFMERRRKPAPQPAQTGDFDPDAFMAGRRQPKPQPKRQTAEADLLRYDPKGYDERGRPLTQVHAEFEQKPFLERKATRAHEAFAQGGLHVSKMARQALGAGLGVAGALQGKAFERVDIPAWRQREEEATAELERRRLARPEPSFGEEVGGGLLEGVPSAAAALGLGALTGGGALGTMAIGGGMSAAGADWRDPKRAAMETAVGAVAPVVGGKIGQKVGGAVAGRLARPAAQATARAGGELVGGGVGNVGGAMVMGETRPRELAKQFAVGAGLSAPGAAAAARRPIPARPAVAPTADPPQASAPAPAPAQASAPPPALPSGVRVVRQGEPIPPREKGLRRVPLDVEQPDGTFETVLVIAPYQINGKRVNDATLRSFAEQALQPQPTAQQSQPVIPNPRNTRGAIIAQPSSLPSRKLLPPGRPEDVPTEQLDAPRTRETPAIRQRIEAENALTAGLAPLAAPETQRTPVVRPLRVDQSARATAELPRQPQGRPEMFRQTAEHVPEIAQEPTNRITTGEGAELPPRVGRPIEGQPVETLTRSQTAEFPEVSRPGRKVTQEFQVPGGLKKAESFISREDARRGHFDTLTDDELVGEIRRMEEIQNQAISGRSKLTPEQLEANRFDHKIAVEQQIERGRIQSAQGREPGERIAPRTPGRPARKIQHSTLGEVTEAADQKGVPAGKIRVVSSTGKVSEIQNPRTRGNRSAAFVKSTGAIPSGALSELRDPNAPPSPLAGRAVAAKAGPRTSFAIPDEAMPELRDRPKSKGTIMGSGFGALQGLFERKAPKANPSKADIESASIYKSIGSVLRTGAQGLRTFKTAFDLSAPLSQGKYLTIPHPRKAIQSFGKMLRSLSRDQSDAIDTEIALHPLRKLGEDAGLFLATSAKLKGNKTGGEEMFQVEGLNRLAGFSHSERTYRTYLDTLRLSVWEGYVKSLQAEGKTFESHPKAYRDAAAFINIASGRGSLKKGGKLEKAMDLGGDILFSPRNLAAKFQLIDPVRYASLAPGARKLVWRDAITSFGTILSTAALFSAAGYKVGFGVEDDDFMTVRFGNTRYDLTGGAGTQVKFLARMVMGAYRKATGEGNLPGKDPLDVAKNFARGKLAPGPGLAIDALKGEDFKGEKFSEKSKTQLAVETVAPMIVEGFYEGFKDEGLKGAAKVTLPSFIGGRVNTFPDRAKSAFIDTPADLRTEQKQFGKTRSFLTPRDGETVEQFKTRQTRVDAWTKTYGSQLASSPRYKAATPEIREAALDHLKKTIADQSGEKRPNLGLLRPSRVLQTVRESEREKRRRAASALK